MKQNSKKSPDATSTEFKSVSYQQAVIDAMGKIYGVPEDIALTSIVEQRPAFLKMFDDGRSATETAEELRPEVIEEYQSAVIHILTCEYSRTNTEATAFIVKYKEQIQMHFERHVPPEEWINTIIETNSKTIDADTVASRPTLEMNNGGVRFVPSEPVKKYLDQLVKTGLFGANRDEVILNMVLRGIEVVLPVAKIAK